MKLKPGRGLVGLVVVVVAAGCGGGSAAIDRSICQESGKKIEAAGSAISDLGDRTGTVDDAAAALKAAKEQLDGDAELAEDPALATQVRSTADALGAMRVALLGSGDLATTTAHATGEINDFVELCDGILG